LVGCWSGFKPPFSYADNFKKYATFCQDYGDLPLRKIMSGNNVMWTAKIIIGFWAKLSADAYIRPVTYMAMPVSYPGTSRQIYINCFF
jgi:hypothetical protein